MALLDVTTLQERRSLLHSVPAEMRLSVLAAANPKLVAEMTRIATQPRRCRDLTAESVEEIISWCQDEDLLVGILENDTRAGVAQAVRGRLNALGSDLTVRQNAKNIRERTERAVAADDPLSALAELKETDAATVMAWYEKLPSHRRDQFLPRLLGYKNHDAALTRALLERSISGEDITAPGQVVRLATAASTVLVEILKDHTGPMTVRLAEAVCTAQLNAYAVPVMPVLPDAITELVDASRIDLLARLECIPADEVCKLATNPQSVEVALSAASSAAYVDALAALLTPRPKLKHGSRATAALEVKGISPDSRFVLLTYSTPQEAAHVFGGDLGDLPTYDEAVRFSEWLKDDRDGLQQLVSSLMRYGYGQEPPYQNLRVLLDALYEHADQLLVVLTKGYYRYHSQSWVTEHFMEKVAETIGHTPGSWEAFFTAAPSHTGTMSDLATAVVLAAS